MKTAREWERRRVGSSPNLEGHLYSVNLHYRSLGVRRGVEGGMGEGGRGYGRGVRGGRRRVSVCTCA